MEKVKKLFGGIDLSWKKLIIFAIIAGVYTASMAIIPQVKYSSLNTITATLEVWILIGIFIIMNSKSNKDSALKCFVFFLISQPLIYLLQVPFSWRGWNLFGYYKFWFIWTILCFPMGYIGYYIKKDKWWGYLILFPMIILTAYSYHTYLTYFTFYYPKYILISLFCAVAMIIYPNIFFNNKKIKIAGTIISSLLIIGITILVILNPYKYSTEILSKIDDKDITNEYKVSLKDSKYGDVSIKYIESIESYMVHADFKKNGRTKLIVETPEGKIKEYDLTIEMDTYRIEDSQSNIDNKKMKKYEKTIDNITLSIAIPDDWKYEELPQNAENDFYKYALKLYKTNENQYAVLYFYNEIFGVCGTGRTSDIINLNNGNKATIGYYDGKEVWQDISFYETNKYIAILNYGLDIQEASEFIEIIKTLSIKY